MVADLVLFLQGVEAVRAVVGVEHTVHVFVALKLNADEVPRFLLVPIGTDPDVLNTRHGWRFALRERDNNFNLEGNVHALEFFSNVNGVGVRCLVQHGLAHQVIDNFPATVVAAFGVVRASDHRAVVHAKVKSEVLGHGRPVLCGDVDSRESHLVGVGVVFHGRGNIRATEAVGKAGDRMCCSSIRLVVGDAHAHVQSSPTMMGLSPLRPLLGAAPIRMIFSRSRPNPSISASGRGGQPGM